MTSSRMRNGAATMLGAVFLLGLAGCAHDPYYRHPHPHPAPRPHYYYDYYYYPSVSVYFHYYSGYYYYPSGKTWIRSRTLPPHYRLDYRDRRQLRIPGDYPYSKYDVHRERYKPRPGYHPDPRVDRKEREHNTYKYKQYHKPRKSDPQRR